MSNLFMSIHHQRLKKAEATKTTATDIVAAFATEETEDAFENTLSLKLNKPDHWKWELTTSRSCSNIALPRIMLYDHRGTLLADANSQEEQIIKQNRNQKAQCPTARNRSNCRAATSNLVHSIRQALDREFDGLKIQEATPSPEPHAQKKSPDSFCPINFYTTELPDFKQERCSNSLKGVRFKVNNGTKSFNTSFNLVDLPTPPSTTTSITATPTVTSSSSGPCERRRYRRSHSSGGLSAAHSESILERFSYQKGRFSSPECEYIAEHEVPHAPRYFLRTSKAGTLVIQQDSFSRYRRRRKPKNSSNENIQLDCSSKSQSTNSLKITDSVTLSGVSKHLRVPNVSGRALKTTDVANERTRMKVVPVRRYRSDCTFRMHNYLSSSDDEELEIDKDKAETTARHQRRYSNCNKPRKRDGVTIDPGNVVLHSQLSNGSSIAR